MKNSFFYCDPKTGRILIERRSGIDRRNRGILYTLLAWTYRRRKSAGRRRTDKGGYVDVYDYRTWCVAISIMLLSLMDAVLTGLHLVKGSARELNPLMNAVLNHGGFPAFFSVKAAMTILPVAIIMLHKEWALGRYAARLCLWSYIILSLYHMYVIFGPHKLVPFLNAA
jgi:hypothetical protein